jgi:hypothetical protein
MLLGNIPHMHMDTQTYANVHVRLGYLTSQNLQEKIQSQ